MKNEILSIHLQRTIIAGISNSFRHCATPYGCHQPPSVPYHRSMNAVCIVVPSCRETHAWTARPAAERLQEALLEMTLTMSKGPQQTYGHLTLLHALQQRLLDALGCSSEI